jgi:hypothetical protein
MRALSVALVLAAVGLCGLAVDAGAKKQRDCAKGGHTIAKNRRARVFRVRTSQGYSAYACILPHGRVRHLGDFVDDVSEFEGVYGFVLAGRFVAYEDAFCDNTDCTGSIKSLNIASREMVHRARIPPGEGEMTVLVVNTHGSIAWTRDDVWKCDARKCAVLDRDDSLEARSLKLRHNHELSWRHADGTRYSAWLK